MQIPRTFLHPIPTFDLRTPMYARITVMAVQRETHATVEREVASDAAVAGASLVASAVILAALAALVAGVPAGEISDSRKSISSCQRVLPSSQRPIA